MVKSFGRVIEKVVYPILKSLKDEKKKLKELLVLENSSDLLKEKKSEIEMMIANDWDVAIDKLESLKKRIASSTSFEDFYQWKDEIIVIQHYLITPQYLLKLR